MSKRCILYIISKKVKQYNNRNWTQHTCFIDIYESYCSYPHKLIAALIKLFTYAHQ